MACIWRIIAVHGSGNHNAQGRPHFFHRANLHRRSMRAQQQPLPLRLRLLARDKQSILRIPRRMIRRKIQSLEVVVVSFNHRPLGNRVPKLLEDSDHLVRRLDDRMLGAHRPPDSWQADINNPAIFLCWRTMEENLALSNLDQTIYVLLEPVDLLTDERTGGSRSSFQP